MCLKNRAFIYELCNTKNECCTVSAQEARNILVKTNVDKNVLAQVWLVFLENYNSLIFS